MNNKIFQKAKNLVFALALALGLLLPASATLALPQKAGPVARVLPTPNDTQYVNQWSLFYGDYKIDAPAAWAITTGSASTVVAVIDTGITDHEDLNDDPSTLLVDENRILPGYDFITNSSFSNDGDGRDADAHDDGDANSVIADCAVTTNSTWRGTKVAGIIGANSNNTKGIAGIDWNAQILPVRVSGRCGGVRQDIVDGMLWAAGIHVSGVPDNTKPAKVLNLSAGWAGACTTADQAVIDAITAQGAVVVVAAGNTSIDPGTLSPASCNGVITVAATDINGNLANYSNSGSTVKISAPGGTIGNPVISTSNIGTISPDAGTYLGVYGTSIAAAHVSGVVSLMFMANPRITPGQVLQILQKTATLFFASGGCTTSICGSGIVNAGEAVRVANMPDLVITGVTLSNTTPSLSDTFDVRIDIKNRGGVNLGGLNPSAGTVVDRVVFIDANPTNIAGEPGYDANQPTFTRDVDGCPVPPLGTIEFSRKSGNESIASGATSSGLTYPVTATGLEGMHKIYAYADVDCNIIESFEDNNNFAPVTINPFIYGALLIPKNNIGTDYNPTYKWNRVVAATSYRLWVNGPNGLVWDQWYTALSICGPSNGATDDTCAVAPGPGATLGGGNYSWKVQSYSPAGGNGPWSAEASFSTAAISPMTKPSVVTNLQVVPTAGDEYIPTFTWNKVNGVVTWYLLLVNGPGGEEWNQWYTAGSICDSTTCTVDKPVRLGSGNHTWMVQAYNPAGYGPWATGATFAISPLTKPSVVTNLQITPTPGDEYIPSFTWTKASGMVTWYLLLVNGPGGEEWNKWYTSGSVCGATTCTVDKPVRLGSGNHSWMVQAYNPAGYGPWATGATFAISPLTKPSLVTNLQITPTPGDEYVPSFTWTKASGMVTWYLLLVNGPGGEEWNKWYTSGSVCGATTCTVDKPVRLGSGNHSWMVQAYNPAGYGPWATGPSFVTSPLTKPAQVDLRALDALSQPYSNPAEGQNLGTEYTPTFTWQKASGVVTWYLLLINGSDGGEILNKWYTSGSICGATVCTVPSPVTLGGGHYYWWVQAYNPAGYGPWSLQTNFHTDPLTAPMPAANLVTSLPVTHTPTYKWDKTRQLVLNGPWVSDRASWYRLYVKGPNGVVLDQWYQSLSTCSAGTCSVVSPTTLISGDFTWWVQTYNTLGYGSWTKATFTVP